MSEGEFKKRIDSLTKEAREHLDSTLAGDDQDTAERYGRVDIADKILKILEEAKKGFPQYYIEESKDFKEGCFTKIEYDDFFDLIDWFKKWFGVE